MQQIIIIIIIIIIIASFRPAQMMHSRRELTRLSWLAAQTLADGVTYLRVEQSVDPCNHKCLNRSGLNSFLN